MARLTPLREAASGGIPQRPQGKTDALNALILDFLGATADGR